ncbi:hypothetical protein GP486_003118 [Trichoglossum hirsutum]|uniref:Uncharacterized protein n=1 Tax=Trichoglossum hirsutum TaxID=265104 RepID=A0A9P8LDI7_9PEZI|nr:hypothetical protein GP486_003118 [Trichoglossum hirsutum]
MRMLQQDSSGVYVGDFEEFLEENPYFEHECLVDATEIFGWFYDSHGRYNDAAEQYERAVDLSTETLGLEHVATLRRIEDLASVRRNQGRYAEIRSPPQIRLACSGKERRFQASGLSSRSVTTLCHRHMYGLHDDVQYYHHIYAVTSLSNNEKRLGRDNVETLHTIGPSHSKLRKAEGAAIYRGKYRDAEQLHRRVLVHPETLKTIHNIALTKRMRVFLEVALGMHSQALMGGREQLGPEDQEALRMMEGLGVANQFVGHSNASRDLLSHALNSFQKQLGPHYPNTLCKAESLANIHFSLRQFTEASRPYRDAYEMSKKDLETRRLATLRVGNNLAVSLFKLGYLGEAESLCTDAL